jgi:hypothetical protein
LQRIVFHEFTLGDVEDPELYAAVPLGKFMDTELGHWVKQNCDDPQYIIRPDPTTFGTRVIVYGEVCEQAAVFYQLKWGTHVRTMA